MRMLTRCVLGSVILCSSFSSVYAAEGVIEQPQDFNKQIEVKVKAMQEKQQKQMQALDKEFQVKVKDVHDRFQTKVQEINDNMNKRRSAMQKDFQAQIKKIHDERKKPQ